MEEPLTIGTEHALVAPPVPWIDTAEVHALAAWRRAVSGIPLEKTRAS